jgi:hypothetical protein
LKIMPRPRVIHGRSPGERAFDWCLLPYFLCFLVTLTSFFRLTIHGRGNERVAMTGERPSIIVPDPAWHPWIPFGIGILLAIYWVWTFRNLLRSWSDPFARVLRYCSVVLLLGLLLPILALLRGR